MKRITALAGGVIFALSIAGLSACGQSDADVASKNLSKAAENFEVVRRVVFFNGITDTYLMTIEGRCSIEAESQGWLTVTCKVADGYKKHFLGLSDNVSYFVEQLDAKNVSTAHYRVVFKPSTIIPDIDIR